MDHKNVLDLLQAFQFSTAAFLGALSQMYF